MLRSPVEGSLSQALETLRERGYRRALLDPSFPFERIAEGATQVVIFGCGNLGELALSGLRAAGCEPVAFVDNNHSLCGRTFRGVPVLSPRAGVDRFNDEAFFVVAIYNGSSPRNQLAALGCKRIVPYPLLFWRFHEHMKGETRLELPDRILRGLDRLQLAYAVLSDQKSRIEFAAQIFWRCSLDYSRLPPHDPASEMYFPHDLIRLREDEVFMDCGAFDGDSIRLFLERARQQYRRIIALEPDPNNREALMTFVQAPGKPLYDVSILPYAVSDHSGTVLFNANGSVGSSLSTSGLGITVECRRIDELADLEAPTFIKMDIEGAEPDALEGAKETLRNARPILAVCAYHKCEHLWQIPLIMAKILPEYQISLRRYAEECWETVYYAIPPERVIPA
jgi:FkbM family methyltransferase